MKTTLKRAQFGISPQDIGNILPIPAADAIGFGAGLLGGGGSQPAPATSQPDPAAQMTGASDTLGFINEIMAALAAGEIGPQDAESLIMQATGEAAAMQTPVDPAAGTGNFDLSALFPEDTSGQVQPVNELEAILSMLPLFMEAGAGQGTPSTQISSASSFDGGTKMQESLPAEMQGQAPMMAPTWNPASSAADWAIKQEQGNVLGHSLPGYELNQGAQNDYLANLAAFFSGTMEQQPSYSSSSSQSVGGMPGQAGDPGMAIASIMAFLDQFMGRGQEQAQPTFGNGPLFSGLSDALAKILNMPEAQQAAGYTGPTSPAAMAPQYGIPRPGGQFPGMTAGLPFGR